MPYGLSFFVTYDTLSTKVPLGNSDDSHRWNFDKFIHFERYSSWLESFTDSLHSFSAYISPKINKEVLDKIKRMFYTKLQNEKLQLQNCISCKILAKVITRASSQNFVRFKSRKRVYTVTWSFVSICTDT